MADTVRDDTPPSGPVERTIRYFAARPSRNLLEAKMWTDPIVEELHRIREEHAARLNFEMDAIVADLRRVEAEWPGPKIDPPPRRPETCPRSMPSETE